MLHGWGFNAGVWQAVTERLAGSFQIHVVDLPGHGHSPSPDGNNYSLASVIDTLLSAVPENAHWLGWSLGGTLAMAVALQQPQRVSRLVLVTATPKYVNGNGWQHGIDKNVFDQFTRQLLDDSEKTIKRFLSLQTMGSPDGRLLAQHLWKTLAVHPQPQLAALQGGLEILEQTDLRDQLNNIYQPTLVVHGDRDQLVPAGAARFLAANIKNSREKCFTGSGHIPFITHSDEFCQTITDFLYV
jgi:pimeloyl-[acyl-carrier protein] methyl ester esterase